MRIKELCNGKSVFTMSCHSDMQTFKSEIEQESVLGRLDRTKIPHKLNGSFCDECSALTETLGINNSVIAVIGRTETGELIGMSHPVKITRINNTAADACSVTVHILCR